MQSLKYLNLILALSLLSASCGKKSESFSDASGSSANSDRMLFVASGGCYAGGVATSVGAFTISAFNLESGMLERIVVDYNSLSPGDAPVGIAEYDAKTLMVLVENAAGRRIDLVKKDGSAVSTYLTNSTALGGVVRGLAKLPDNSVLVSKSTAVEKFSPAKSRVTQGASPYVNAPGSTCATATTLISSINSLSNGKILFTHAAATPNNKISIIAATGYATTADCLASVASPTTLAMPTVALVHSSGKLIVSFGSTTAASNFIYGYDLDVTSNIISGATAAFSDPSIIYGPSSMTEDPETGAVFVANGNSAFNTIEKLRFNSSTKVLTRDPGLPFIAPQVYTRCVSDMKVLPR